MTDKIKRYMELKNAPITGSFQAEKELIDEMLSLIGKVPNLKEKYVIRYIVDSGSRKECVYESGWGAESEVAFILNEIQKVYKGDRVFATVEHIYELGESDGEKSGK